jgi:hypothetical protein
MRHFRAFCVAAALTFAFAHTTLADDGVIHGGIAPPPPPAPHDVVDNEPVSDELTLLALDLVRSVIGLY